MASLFPYCPVNHECHVKENPDRKKTGDFNIDINTTGVEVAKLDENETCCTKNRKPAIDFDSKK